VGNQEITNAAIVSEGQQRLGKWSQFL